MQANVLCALRTIAGAFGIEFSQDTEVNNMEESVKAILEDGRLGLNEKQLQALDEDAIKALAAALKAMPKVEARPEPESNTEPEAKPEAQETEAKPEAKPEARPETNEAMQVLERRLAALETAARSDTDARKAKLVAALVSNAACAVTKAQLSALDVDTLEGLHRSLSPADYSGRGGGPVTSNDGIERLVMPDIFAVEV